MSKEEVMLHLNRIFNQLVEKYGSQAAIEMFEDTVEVAKLISKPRKKEKVDG